MGQLDRQEDICQYVKTTIENSLAANWSGLTSDVLRDPYLEVRVEDFAMTAEPTRGVIVSPDDIGESIGTNERDDIVYSVLVTRIVHALGNDDRIRRTAFRRDLELLFHNKKHNISAACLAYAVVSPGQVAIPKAWSNNNNSILITRIVFAVRESRERE